MNGSEREPVDLLDKLWRFDLLRCSRSIDDALDLSDDEEYSLDPSEDAECPFDLLGKVT